MNQQCGKPDNPWIGIEYHQTLAQCQATCAAAANKKGPCVGVEWASLDSSNPHTTALCYLCYSCNSFFYWGGGSFYKLERSTPHGKGHHGSHGHHHGGPHGKGHHGSHGHHHTSQ